MIQILRLTDPQQEAFPYICQWYFTWLGKVHQESMEEVVYTMQHSLNRERLPQTYVAYCDGIPAGMYQLAVADDLTVRPDLYPWLINGYVAEPFRNRGVFRAMMESVPQASAAAGLRELYLYTEHVGLYEKFGWQFLEEVNTFQPGSPTVRVYHITL